MDPKQLVEQFGADVVLAVAETLLSMQPEELKEFLEMLQEIVQEEGSEEQVHPEAQQPMPSGQQNLFGGGNG